MSDSAGFCHTQLGAALGACTADGVDDVEKRIGEAHFPGKETEAQKDHLPSYKITQLGNCWKYAFQMVSLIHSYCLLATYHYYWLWALLYHGYNI